MMRLIAFTKWIYDKPIKEMAEILAGAGFDGVDLPVRAKSGVPEETAIKSLREYAAIFRDHGLTLDRLVTDVVAPRPDLDPFLAAVREAGVTKIRLGGKSLGREADPRAALDEHKRHLEALEPILAKHGIWGAIQIHSGDTAHATMGLCLHCLEGRDPARLGIQVDTGHLMVAGESPELALALAGPYLHSVNLKAIRKDIVIDPKTARPSSPKIVVPLRDAMVDWTSILRAIKKSGYDDSLCLHAEYRSAYYSYEHDAPFTSKMIAADRAFIAGLMAELGI